jgi:hypothetical protein
MSVGKFTRFAAIKSTYSYELQQQAYLFIQCSEMQLAEHMTADFLQSFLLVIDFTLNFIKDKL